MSRTSKATASWAGTLKAGAGEFAAESGAFKGEYSFPTRFESRPGTNPEELIAAAHAACFSMALASVLEKGGSEPKTITTTAHCTLEVSDAGPRITTMKLVTRGTVPGIDQSTFESAAQDAKNNCPVSKALKGNLTVELSATLEA